MEYRIYDYYVELDEHTDVLDIYLRKPDNITLRTLQGSIQLTPASSRIVIEAIRLIADETNGGTILCSTSTKANVTAVYEAQTYEYDFFVRFNLGNLYTQAEDDDDYEEMAAIESIQADDQFTIKMDWGDNILSLTDTVLPELQGGKQAIATALRDKGATVSDNAGLIQMASIIASMGIYGDAAFEQAFVAFILDNFTFSSTPTTAAQCFTLFFNRGLRKVHTRLITSVSTTDSFSSNAYPNPFGYVTDFELPAVTSLGSYAFNDWPAAQRIIMSNLRSIGTYGCFKTTMRVLDFSSFTGNFHAYNNSHGNLTTVIELHTAQTNIDHGAYATWDHTQVAYKVMARLTKFVVNSNHTRANHSFKAWIPTYAATNHDLSNCVIDTDQCSTNGEQIDYSARVHILGNMDDLTISGQNFTVTFSSTVYDLLSEQTLQAFADKGWTVARAE